MSRFHLFPRLIPEGVCYEIQTVLTAPIHYFKDETSWANILGLLERPWYSRWLYQPWIAWEMDADASEIVYRVWTPNEEIGRQFQLKYYSEHPYAEINQVAPVSWDFSLPHAGTKFFLARHYVVPLKTYHNDVVDTQAEIMSLLESLQANEKVWIQFLLKPAYHTHSLFVKAMSQLTKEVEQDGSLETETALYRQAIQGKKARKLARMAIRVVASAASKEEAVSLINACRRSFGQFSSGELNELYGREWWRIIRPLFRYECSKRIFSIERQNKSVVLSAEELAMMLRLPSGKVQSNKLTRMKMRRTPLPPEVRALTSKTDGIQIPIGTHYYHGQTNEVTFDLAGFNRHMAVWGGTMMGKSTFIYNFLEDMMNKRTEKNEIGFTVIDPHGSLAADIASRVPKEQQHLVRYVRFKDGQFPFNVYDVDFATSQDKIAQNVADVCKRVWKDFWGPNVDDNFLNGGIALQRVGEASLYNLRMVLEDDAYRTAIVARLDDSDPIERQLRLFLSKYDGLDERVKEPKINSTLNKLRKITLSATVGTMLRAETNGIHWREGMDQGYYHIFDLSGLTMDERRLMGSMCMTFTQLAMLSREELLAAGKPMPLHPVIVDEAPTFMDQSADAIQSFADEARKYNVPLVLGMQGLEGQVPDQVASAIFRNFGTYVAYRVGHTKDAENICEGMKSPDLTPEDFQRIEPNFAYVRMAIGRETTLPFLVQMNPPKPPQCTGDVPGMIQDTLDRALAVEQERLDEKQARLEEQQRIKKEREDELLEEETPVKKDERRKEDQLLQEGEILVEDDLPDTPEHDTETGEYKETLKVAAVTAAKGTKQEDTADELLL